jgi:hypothetical protein
MFLRRVREKHDELIAFIPAHGAEWRRIGAFSGLSCCVFLSGFRVREQDGRQ